MKYLPTLDLWNPAISSAVRQGQIKLQRGQWVKCGNLKPSRFVRITSTGSIWAVHPREGKVSNKRFQNLCQ